MKHRNFKKDYLILALIIGAAILARVFTIWVGRPEFVGWFSHTYYYFVEVRGILENGALVYSDMPLLFYIYALISKILIFFGVEQKLAIVTSTRFVMSVFPALTAIPIYLLIKSINDKNNLNKKHWLLVIISTILPLTLTHLPEILQKNMFALVLFVFLQLAIYQLLKSYNHKKLFFVIFLTLLIFLSHLGTLAATLIYFFAIITAYLINSGNFKKTLLCLIGFFVLAGIFILGIYFLDISRFNRIIYYFATSISNSQIGLLFLSQTILEKLQFFGAITFTGLIAYLFYWIYHKFKNELNKPDKIFLSSNFIFIILLLFPLLDVDLLVRFILFIPISVIIIQIYLFKYLRKKWIKNVLVGLFLFVCATTAFGEFMGIFMRNANNKQIQQEIGSIKDKGIFLPNDFVITKYAVNPMCNWFFNTKAGLITSLNKEDFNKHRKIFILNPTDGQIPKENLKNLVNKKIETEADKYEIMRSNILIPNRSNQILQTENIEIYEIKSPPENWKFDSNGYWVGYLNDYQNP